MRRVISSGNYCTWSGPPRGGIAGGGVAPSSLGCIEVSAPVGIARKNLPNDVKTVQDALNRVGPEQGGPPIPLLVDGLCGPKTRDAIQKFQLHQFGWPGADGKVHPGGQTITRLRQLLGATGRATDVEEASGSGPLINVGEASDEVLLAAIAPHLLEAQRWIRVAYRHLSMALDWVDEPDGPPQPFSASRAERMKWVNHYFRIDDLPAEQRRATLHGVRRVFGSMGQVFEKPGGLWGSRTFEIDRTGEAIKENPHAKAWVYPGGFYRGTEVNIYQPGLRSDSIFLVHEHFLFFALYPFGTKVIVHELAHFCGDHRIGWSVVDYDAFGEPEKPSVAALTPDQRVRHADTYALFAQKLANR